MSGLCGVWIVMCQDGEESVRCDVRWDKDVQCCVLVI